MFSSIVKRSLATATVGAAGVTAVSAVSQPTVYADEKKKSKLSIYDEPQPEIVIVESPTKLEEHVAYAQKYANERVEEGKTHVNSLRDQWQKFEQDVKNTVQQTVDKDEDILPNGLYVGVAALAGTIIARNRNIIIRFATSTALAVGTSYYLLPKTTHNVTVQYEKFESQYPQLQAAHKSINDSVADVRKQIDDAVSQFRGTVDENKAKFLSQFQGKDGETAQDKFESVKKNVESMYSTRSNPGVEETLKKNN
ncbi:apolipo protein O-domain-containing protein [Syncephalastrum racemosum]|uniref:MICOS complex subunit n=1 Tax=Syncephalastrum racemosum TaxID=13706 RepID=A0A1X2H4T2_SYNRA|nr:apolipo protein O-domain-containing protein [Syncephalastrum racemosum]